MNKENRHQGHQDRSREPEKKAPSANQNSPGSAQSTQHNRGGSQQSQKTQDSPKKG